MNSEDVCVIIAIIRLQRHRCCSIGRKHLNQKRLVGNSYVVIVTWVSRNVVQSLTTPASCSCRPAYGSLILSHMRTTLADAIKGSYYGARSLKNSFKSSLHVIWSTATLINMSRYICNYPMRQVILYRLKEMHAQGLAVPWPPTLFASTHTYEDMFIT